MIKCPKCKRELEDGAIYCDKCGTSIVEGKKNKKRNLIVFSLIITVVLSICVTVIFVNLTKEREFIFYLKNNELYTVEIDSLKPVQITANLNDVAIEYSDKHPSYFNDVIEVTTKTNKENKEIFYIDENHDLYSKNSYDLKGGAKLIANNIYRYSVSEDGKTIAYINDVNELYLSNMTETKCISDNVYRFQLATDGSSLLYECYSSDIYSDIYDIYFVKNGEEPVKLNSEPLKLHSYEDVEDQIGYVSNDLAELFILENKVLFKYVNGKKDKEVASNVAFITQSFKDGSFYYAQKKEDVVYSLVDFVEDDMLETDKNLKQPTKPTYPSIFDYDSYSDLYDARSKYYDLYDEYEEDLEKYEDKIERDDLREYLKTQTYSYNIYDLYYYDGEKATLISDKLYSLNDDPHFIIDTETNKIVYTTLDINDIQKMKLSDLNSYSESNSYFGYHHYYDTTDYIREHLDVYVRLYAAQKNISMSLGDFAVSYQDLDLHSNDDLIYYRAYNETYETYDLYYAKISDGATAAFQLFDTDIEEYYLLNSGNVVTEKQELADSYKYYLNGEYVDTVPIMNWTYFYFSDSNNTLYYHDQNNEGNKVLKSYKNGKIEIIHENVESYYMTKDNDIFYIAVDESDNMNLYFYSNGKHKLIDTDINCFIYPNTYSYLEKI